jgi:peptidoglycan/LPS O-acetylase OafA/YrhL
MIYSNFRNQKIDFLRGIAIIAVLILHFNLSYHIGESALNKIFSVDFIKTIASNGNYGVTMFFVISGFLITSTSLERYGSLGKIDIIGFYIFRFARIMPCLV